MLEIRVINAEDAEATLNTEGIVSEIVDSDIVQVEADEFFTSLDLLADMFLLPELVELDG